MPTKRRGRVRHLLKEGKAVVIKTHPFTVKMKYDAGHYTQPMYEGIDSGRQKEEPDEAESTSSGKKTE